MTVIAWPKRPGPTGTVSTASEAAIRPIAGVDASPMFHVEQLRVAFRSDSGWMHAVDGVDLSLRRGEVLALLGESGCGKSVTLRALLRLLPGSAKVEGRIDVDGTDVTKLSGRALADFRGKVVSMIFQEPMLAFDPVCTVGDQIAETIVRHEGLTHGEARARALALFERVRIPSARTRLDAYPHELSGGMRQRAMIALALACRPRVLLADEPTTALDATVQIQILLLLRELQQETGMSVVFVTHDVGVAAEIADRVAVMYAGRVIEEGPATDVLVRPAHPYTRGLLGSMVDGGRRGERIDAIPGAPPALREPIRACAFAPRCTLADAACLRGVPPLHRMGEGWRAACVRPVDAPMPARAMLES